MVCWWRGLQGQEIEKISESSGLFYELSGILRIYPLKWKVVSYVNVEPTSTLWQSTKKQVKTMKRFCSNYESEKWYHHTDCEALGEYTQKKVQYVNNLKNLVQEYMENKELHESKRKRRGIINFVGEIFNILFGTMSHSDAKKYNEQISKLEQEQIEFLHLAKDQMTVIKSAIRSVNQTIVEVSQNEVALKRGLKTIATDLQNITNELSKEVRMVNYINENVRLILRGLEECQSEYTTLLEAFVHAAQGIMQPQLITTEKIKEVMMKSELPAGMDFPNFPLSQLLKLITPHTYFHNYYLVYVLDIPILSSKHYQLYHMTPAPTLKIGQTFVFIHPQKEYIFTDPLRQQFGKMSREDLKECFQLHELLHVCNSKFPLTHYSDNTKDCEAALLHPSTRIIPESCDKRLIILHDTYWIPLMFGNEWIFSSPVAETVAAICDQKQTKLEIQGTGILKLSPGCTAYTNHVTLQATKEKESNVTMNFFPSISINYDCCIEAEKATKISQLKVDVPLNNIMNSVDDLKIASIKIEEVDQLIKEQEKKTDYSRYLIHASSWLGVVGSTAIFLLCTCCCCCCNKRCRFFMFWLWDRWTPRDCVKETRERLSVNFFQPLPGSTINVNTEGPLTRHSSVLSLREITEKSRDYPGTAETSFSKTDLSESAVYTRTRSKDKVVKPPTR